MFKPSKKVVKFVLIAALVFMFIPMLNIYAADPPAPVGPTPNARQLEWYHREQMGFIHFGINTFYDQEWGNGSEDPARFNPTSLDAAQWVKTFKDAGFTTIILVTKHHDGFCYWPSAYTTHDVASSPWRGGKGDLVREVSDACQAAGIKLGIYLSPWDRHESTYGTSAYNDYFDNQLRELLSNYGPIYEAWFDGAGEAAGTYDWARWANTIHTLQPTCVIWGAKSAYNQAELRWIGNEGGVAGDPNWATIDPYNIQVEDCNILNTGQVNGSAFIPGETNTSIRPGWFYHSSQDSQVKSVDSLWDYYFTSVGRNSVMLLNIPPDTRGLMHSTDVNNVLGLYSRVYNTFSNNLAADSTVTATDTRGSEYSPQNLIDNDENTYYASSDGVTTPAITFTLNGSKTFDCVKVQEVLQLGHRVTGWAVDAYYNNQWNTLVTKECIGYKWLERFNPVTASAVRLRITSAKACPAIHSFGIYLQSNAGPPPTPTPTVPTRSAFSQIEAESYNSKYGTVQAETCGEGGQNLGFISNGDWVCYNSIDFGSGAIDFQARVASAVTTGKIYVRLDTPTGTQIGTLTVPNTGNSQTYTTATCTLNVAKGGVHDLYLYFDAWANLNWFQFTPAPVTPTPTNGPRSAFSPIEAESYDTQSGIQSESCAEGGQNIGYIENGDYAVYNNIDFGSGATGFETRVASNTSGGSIEIRLDGLAGALVGTCQVAGTGGWQNWVDSACSVSGVSGMHNLYLRFTGGSGYLFNVNRFQFTGGTTPTPTATPTATPTSTPSPTRTPPVGLQIEAESFNAQSGIQSESCAEGGQNIGYIENGDYAVYNNIDFGSGATGFQARVASATSGGNIEIRLDGLTGSLVGTCTVAGTGGWQAWVTKTCNVSGASGIHNLYLKFTGGSGYLFNVNWFQFTPGGSGTPTPTATSTPTPTPGNLITNPGLETGNTTGWTLQGAGSVTVSTVQKYSGNYSLLHTGRTAAWNGPLQNIASKALNGKTYACSGWVRLDNAASSTVIMTIKKVDSSGTSYTNVATGTGSNSLWVQLSGSYTLTVSGTLTELSIYFEGPDSGINYYLDDVSVQ